MAPINLHRLQRGETCPTSQIHHHRHSVALADVYNTGAHVFNFTGGPFPRLRRDTVDISTAWTLIRHDQHSAQELFPSNGYLDLRRQIHRIKLIIYLKIEFSDQPVPPVGAGE